MNAATVFAAAMSAGALSLAWLIVVGAGTNVRRPTAVGRPPERATSAAVAVGRANGVAEGVVAGEVAEALAARLRAGVSLPDALGQVSVAEPLRAQVAELSLALRRGVPLTEALQALAADAPPERRLLVAALQLAARHGGRTADALDGVAGTLRDRRAVTAELAAQTSQARFSAWVLVALPPLFLVLGSLVDPRIPGAVATPIGAGAVLVALGLEGAGFVWTRRILASGAQAISPGSAGNVASGGPANVSGGQR